MKKISSYVGFAIKSRNVLVGQSIIKQNKTKQIYCIILCSSASENTKKEAEKLAGKFHCPMLITKVKLLSELTYRENAKVMAITDKALSKAILDNSENDFIAKN